MGQASHPKQEAVGVAREVQNTVFNCHGLPEWVYLNLQETHMHQVLITGISFQKHFQISIQRNQTYRNCKRTAGDCSYASGS